MKKTSNNFTLARVLNAILHLYENISWNQDGGFLQPFFRDLFRVCEKHSKKYFAYLESDSDSDLPF